MLFHAASVRIVRHVKVRSGLNPYDPSWTPHLSLRDPILYELLALVDAIRDGRARERKMAEKELISRPPHLRQAVQ